MTDYNWCSSEPSSVDQPMVLDASEMCYKTTSSPVDGYICEIESGLFVDGITAIGWLAGWPLCRSMSCVYSGSFGHTVLTLNESRVQKYVWKRIREFRGQKIDIFWQNFTFLTKKFSLQYY